MDLERLLALCKQAAPVTSKNQVPTVERFSAAAFLSQLLTDHAGRGRQDPRYVTRAHLLRQDIAISARQDNRLPQKPGSNFAVFNAQRTRRTDGNLSRSQADLRALRQEVRQEWQGMSPLDKAAYRNTAMQRFTEALDNADIDAEFDPQVGYKTLFDAAASEDTPFGPSSFESVVRRELGIADGDRFPGFSRYEQKLRDSVLDSMYIPDRGKQAFFSSYKRSMDV